MLVVTSEPRPGRAGTLSPGEYVDVRYIHAKHMVSHAIWIENWMRILRYLASNAGFVSDQLLTDIGQATANGSTLGAIERDFQPHDIVLVRTAVFMLLHKGRLKANALRVQPLGPAFMLKGLLA